MSTELFSFTEITPHPSLEGIVTHYRLKRAELPHTLALPNYTPIFQGLIFNLDILDDIVFQKQEEQFLKHKVYYVGQAVSPGFLYSSSKKLNIIAVNFTPRGLYRLTGIDMYHFTDLIVDAQLIFGKEIEYLYEQLVPLKSPFEIIAKVDAFLCAKAAKSNIVNKHSILSSVNELQSNPNITSIKELYQLTKTSARTLERNFKTEIGISPKMFQRLLRFNRAKHYLHQNPDSDWWEAIVRFGFYDHSHFISEFRLFSGMTPLQYKNLYISFAKHNYSAQNSSTSF